MLKGKDLVEFILKNNLEEKDVFILVVKDSSTCVCASEKIEFSNNEDDSIFIETVY